jgi:hypothetical protein
MTTGVDYSHARPTRDQLQRHGVRFACRYLLDDTRNKGKALKRDEALQLTAWGVQIVSNFEYLTKPLLTFAQGAADARTVRAELVAIGAPRLDTYFSFDYDVPAGDYAGVLQYLHGAESVLGAGRAGAYGHYGLITYLADHGIRWLWQTYAWSGGRWNPRATIRQVQNRAFPGEFDGDLNNAMVTDFGQWDLQEDDMAYTDDDKQMLRDVHTWLRDGTPDFNGHSWESPVWEVRAHADTQRQIQAAQAAILAALPTAGTGGTDPAAIADAVVAKLKPAQVDVLIEALKKLRLTVME